MNDTQMIILIVVGIFILIGIYFILSEGSVERTKRILHLKKDCYKYNNNLISVVFGVHIILCAGIISLLYILVIYGFVGKIIWLSSMVIYYIIASKIIKNYIINSKRFMN